MRFFTRISRAFAAGLGILCAATAMAQADTYPAKPIRLLVAYAPGGITDAVARQLAAAITEKTGQQVLVDNKPGGASQIAIQALMTAPADGYTLMLADPSPITINPYLFKKLSYKADALAPVTRITRHYVGLIVRDDSPYKSVKDYVAAAKAEPGKLMFSQPGAGTNIHLSGMQFNNVAGINVTDVPYKGDSPSLQDVMAGNVAAAWASIGSALPLVQGGKLRVLAVMAEQRIRSLPQVPTFVEAGYPSMATTAWLGIFAPAGTPAPALAEANRVFRTAVQSPKVVEWMGGNAMDSVSSSPQELGDLVKADSAVFSSVIQRIGLTLD